MSKKTKIITVALLALLALLVLVANVWRRQSQVREVRVDIDYCGIDTLVTSQQVVALVSANLPSLVGKKISDVDLEAVEKAAAKSPFLRNCQASTTIGRSVVVFAAQRRPIVRVFSQAGEFYVDDQGAKLPLSPLASCDVIVASGHIPASGQGLKDVWTLALYLDQHPDLSALFDQIYRAPSNDLFLTPKIGSHVVELGPVDNLDEKFSNILALYSRGLSKAGWDTYSQVSVKYRGQVVCTKRNR